jgi:hypothetical protein
MRRVVLTRVVLTRLAASSGAFHDRPADAGRRSLAGGAERRMTFDVSVALTWILFLALFPITFFWLRRAWRIVVRHDYSHVALKRGVPPPHPERFAPFAAGINFVAGAITASVIMAVV